MARKFTLPTVLGVAALSGIGVWYLTVGRKIKIMAEEQTPPAPGDFFAQLGPNLPYIMAGLGGVVILALVMHKRSQSGGPSPGSFGGSKRIFIRA